MRRTLAVTVAAVAVAAAAGQPAVAHGGGPPSPPDAVTAWNENAGNAALAACLAPTGNSPWESRLYAMTHLAIHDALNAIDRRSAPYALDLRVDPGASPDAAVGAAARDVMVALFAELPESATCRAAAVASVEADYAEALGAIPAGPAKTVGILTGRAAAAAILAVRGADGADAPPLVDEDFPQGTAPGEWRFTPGVPFAFAPRWGEVTPFTLRDSAQFRPGPPDAVTRRSYTRDFNEVKRLGGDDVTTPSDRTADETQVGIFWDESSPLMWNRIARRVSADRRVGLWENARLFGLLNAALADGYIATFDTKYHYRYWRPVTAIHEAGSDGNPDTVADPTWTPLLQTPPIPDYDSGHAVEGGAAAAVLRRFFGTDHVAFEACSLTLASPSRCTDTTPAIRRFGSFSEAADENARSRILNGFHFRKAVEEGVEHGRRVGTRAVRRFLRPAHDHGHDHEHGHEHRSDE